MNRGPTRSLPTDWSVRNSGVRNSKVLLYVILPFKLFFRNNTSFKLASYFHYLYAEKSEGEVIPEILEVEEGQTAQFICRVIGDCPRMYWTSDENEAPAVRTLSWYITGLQVLYITSLVPYYKLEMCSVSTDGERARPAIA